MQRVAREFDALRRSWIRDSSGDAMGGDDHETQFDGDERRAAGRHLDLLNQFAGDVDKFLHKVPIKLARFETEYSWKFREELDTEISALLAGLLTDKPALDCSLGSLSRCGDLFSDWFSGAFLRSEIEQRFNQRRTAPLPDFLGTLDHARTLSGAEFEQWIEARLRAAGCSDVALTKASHDQGADLSSNFSATERLSSKRSNIRARWGTAPCRRSWPRFTFTERPKHGWSQRQPSRGMPLTSQFERV
jgi:hypothetical protein